MLKAIRRFFGEKASGQMAKERMQVILTYDRMDLTPDILDSLKNEIIDVLSRYVEFDRESIQVNLEKGRNYTALVSNVHIKKVFRPDVKERSLEGTKRSHPVSP